MSSVITVKVNKLETHPNASKLQIAEVTDGNQAYSVVCGAKNVRVDMVTILAKVGSTTPKGVKIQVSELRGIESHGMLCSAKDLAILEEDGIIDLPDNTKLGVEFTQLDKSLLSSTPWFNYKEVEAFFEDDFGRIWVYRDGTEPEDKKDYRLISKTYYNDGSYQYRNFI